MSKDDVINFNINPRRSSIPYNFFRRSSGHNLSIAEELNREKLNESVVDHDELLTPLDHLEILLVDMNDFCEYGNEILNSLQETRKEYSWFKHLYNKNKELKNKIVQLKE